MEADRWVPPDLPPPEFSTSARVWSLIIGATWGAIIAALVAWLDGNWYAAAAWAVAGIAGGGLAPSMICRGFHPFSQWYEQFWRDEAKEQRLAELALRIYDSPNYQQLLRSGANEEQLLEYFAEKSPYSAEHKRLSDESCFGMLVELPAILGSFYGTLAGGLLGALYPLQPGHTLPAWIAAALGVIVGPVVFSVLAAIIWAAMVPKTTVPSIARRLILAISPLFAIPALWHCLVYICTERRRYRC
jgi:hypothetical protein